MSTTATNVSGNSGSFTSASSASFTSVQSASFTSVQSAGSDRFIPNRTAMDLDSSIHSLTKENAPVNIRVEHNSKELISEALKQPQEKILAFKEKAPAPTALEAQKCVEERKLLYSASGTSTKASRSSAIPTSAERILDAPDIVDDYYLNLLDWGSNNVLAIALSRSLYLWDATSGETSMLMLTGSETNTITSVGWTKTGNVLAIGLDDYTVQLWD
eukprot:gene10478-1902_t